MDRGLNFRSILYGSQLANSDSLYQYSMANNDTQLVAKAAMAFVLWGRTWRWVEEKMSQLHSGSTERVPHRFSS